MEENLYEKVGGEESIAKVVDYFYSELVLKDDTVNQFLKKQIWKNNAVISQNLLVLH